MTAPRYLILIARTGSALDSRPEVLAASTGLRMASRRGRVAVLVQGPLPFTDLGAQGAIIGSIFYRGGQARRMADFSPSEAREAAGTVGRSLIDRYWGSYVAALECAGEVHILRDPSGGTSCYSAEATWGRAVASDAELLCATAEGRPAVDWMRVARQIYSAALPATRTCLEGVTEILPGTRMAAAATGADLLWSPWQHVAPAAVPDETLVEELRSTIIDAVAALASPYRQILIGVSGGLDSSIVAACLGFRQSSSTCITLATEERSGDERVYARLLCDALGLGLTEAFYGLEDIDLERSAAPHLPRPISRSQSLAYDATIRRAASAQGADAFFTGNGGDNVFAYSHSAAAVPDRLRSEGLGLGVLATVRDICTLTGCSPWQAVAAARRIGRRSTGSPAWRVTPAFLHGDVVAELEAQPHSHPWLDAPAGALPGKAAHVAGLLRIQQHLKASEGAMDVALVNPLMSQPVMEACLRIPTWRWCAGGKDRAAARRAFADLLPGAVVRRRTKGTPDTFCQAIIDAHRGRIRERLLDGHMARRGLLDTVAVDRVLRSEVPDIGYERPRLLALLEAEAWLDHWVA